MPNKKDKLLNKCEEWCDQPVPNFDIMNVDVHCNVNGYQ